MLPIIVLRLRTSYVAAVPSKCAFHSAPGCCSVWMAVADAEAELQRRKFKLVLIGDACVGKTSLINSILHADFSPEYRQTMGVEFYKTEVLLSDGVHTSLQLWDIGGNIRSLQMAANYLQGCDAVLVVFDITRQETYATACQWAGIVEQMFCETGVPLVAVAANKADSQDLQAAAAGLAVPMMASAGACFSYCVSAKTGYSVEHMVHSICARLAGLAVPPPPLQQQHGALQQQPSTELQPTPEPSKARDWRIGWCSKLFCCGP